MKFKKIITLLASSLGLIRYKRKLPKRERRKNATHVPYKYETEIPLHMSNNRQLIINILVFLYSQAPDDKVGLSELSGKIDVSRDDARDALDYLEGKGYVGASGLGRYDILCWITYEGKQILKELKYNQKNYTDEEISRIHNEEYHINTSGEYSELKWELDRLDSNQISIVQRENFINQLIDILKYPTEKRVVFLYGEPQVGKTFVLKRLQETLKDRYVPVFIHMNGWTSTQNQLDFLYELASSIQMGLELFMSDIQIKPHKLVSESQAVKEFSEFMHNLSQRVFAEGRYLVLMFDELEYLTRETDGKIFQYLVSFIENHSQHAKFIFAGSSDMPDMLEQSALSQILKDGFCVCIDCFIKEISRDLMIALTAPYFTFETKALDRIVYLTDGHPSFIKEVLEILFQYWWRNNCQVRVFDINHINTVLKDIRIELSPKLEDIWCRLSMSEKNILQQIAQNEKKKFQAQEIDAERRYHIYQDLNKLVTREILDYSSHDRQYEVRLGLLVDLIFNGILS